MKERLKWSFDGIATLGNTIVGNVAQGAFGEWFAYGMMAEWEDTPLGSFKSNPQARRVVAGWVKEHREG